MICNVLFLALWEMPELDTTREQLYLDDVNIVEYEQYERHLNEFAKSCQQRPTFGVVIAALQAFVGSFRPVACLPPPKRPKLGQLDVDE